MSRKRRSRLKRVVMPRSFDNTADQCREMGIHEGDTIQSMRESPGERGEFRLTLLWLGNEAAVWRQEERASRREKWRQTGEAANWTLDMRGWSRVG